MRATRELEREFHEAVATLVRIVLAAERAEGSKCEYMEAESVIQMASGREDTWVIKIKRKRDHVLN